MSEITFDVSAMPREELLKLIGTLAELSARCQLRLNECSSVAVAPPSRILNGDEAAAIAATSKRWVLSATRGLRFRKDLSRKQPRFEEQGLRDWLASRRQR